MHNLIKIMEPPSVMLTTLDTSTKLAPSISGLRPYIRALERSGGSTPLGSPAWTGSQRRRLASQSGS